MYTDNPALAGALEMMQRGAAVFRLRDWTKDHFIDTDWGDNPFRDPLAAFDAIAATPCNVAVHAGASDLVIVDLDSYKGSGGALADLQAMGPLPETLTVATPRKGLHLYFRAGGAKYTQRQLVPNRIEIKAGRGYALAPGSRTEFGAYTVIDPAPIAPLPDWLAARLAAAAVEGTDAAVCELDTEESIAAAIEWLQERAPVSVEGSRNHDAMTIFRRLGDFGVSVERGLELARDYWNCTPPLPDGEMRGIADRASRNRKHPLGIEHPRAGLVALPPLEKPSATTGATTGADTRNPFEKAVDVSEYSLDAVREIEKRKWIIQDKAVRGYMSLLVAPGGVGKTMLALQYAIAVASGSDTTAAGKALTGSKVVEGVRALYLNLEDPLNELKLRRAAVVKHFGVDPAALGDRLHLFSGFDFADPTTGGRWRVATKHGRDGVKLTEYVGFLADYIRTRKIGFVVVDPLADAHEIDESINPEMSRVMDALRKVVSETGCAMLIVHHTRKPPAASSDSYAGSADSARGASSLLGAVRIAHTLYGMSEKDAVFWGCEADRHRYVRLDDAKSNLFLMSPAASWFERVSVMVENGETLGVLAPVTLDNPHASDAPTMADAIRPHLAGGVTITVNAAASILKALPEWTAESPSTIKKAIVAAFSSGDHGDIVFRKSGVAGGTFALKAGAS